MGENTLQVYVADTHSTATTYTDANVTADVQHVYRVKAINAAGVSGRSNYVNVTPQQPQDNQQVPRQPDNEPATGAPVISGTAVVGETLTADTSGIADGNGLATAVFTYEWLADGVAIADATGSTYTIASDDVGKAISVTVRFIDDAGNAESLTSGATDAVEEEPRIAEQQQVDCSPAIESVGGEASNGRAWWTWESVALDNACGSRWFDFRLSYSTDFGATFTEAAVLRRAILTEEFETFTIGSDTFNRNEESYSTDSIPETSLISVLRVSVGCNDQGENCASTVKSTDESLDLYYYSRIASRTAGANTRALLVPANFGAAVAADSKKDWDPPSHTASVVGTLNVGETHTYRIPMTAGRSYIFDEHFRKWGMMSGEWHGGKHYYLPDEWRISLYTRNRAGQLVPVSSFQNQPKYGWQAITEDYRGNDAAQADLEANDYQPFPSAFDGIATVETYFEFVSQARLLLHPDTAAYFPTGSKHLHVCLNYRNACGPGLNIYKDDGRQLRRPVFIPSRSDVYYLQVARVKDDQPTHRGGGLGWSLLITTTGDAGGIGDSYMPVFASTIDKTGYGVRAALPYYEITVDARGPTLSNVSITGDRTIHTHSSSSSTDWATEGRAQFGFLPGRFEYRVSLAVDTSQITISATAAQSGATVTIGPDDDADTTTDGHQVNTPSATITEVTIKVSKDGVSETYTIYLSRSG